MEHNRISHLIPTFTEHFPDLMEPGMLYISMEYAICAHLCACGCGQKVITPLSPSKWSLTYDGESVTLYPSIGNYAFDCQSHYFLINGRIKWVIENNSKEKKRKKGKGALTQMLNSIKHKDNMGIKPGPKRIAKSTGKPDRRQRDNKKTPGNTPSLKPHNHQKGD